MDNIEPEEDLGHILQLHLNDSVSCVSNEEELFNDSLKKSQQLVNALFKLSRSTKNGAVYINLPEPKYALPRSKPLPKPKPPTKWQKFAQSKGIKKKKKSKLVWDEELHCWNPRYGYKKNAAEKAKTWVRELKPNEDVNEIKFGEEKKERVHKNEYRRLLNIKRSLLTTGEKQNSDKLATCMTIAKASTASLGNFQKKLPKEKEKHGVADITPGRKRKRKLEPMAGSQEKKIFLNVVDDILKKAPIKKIQSASREESSDT